MRIDASCLVYWETGQPGDKGGRGYPKYAKVSGTEAAGKEVRLHEAETLNSQLLTLVEEPGTKSRALRP